MVAARRPRFVDGGESAAERADPVPARLDREFRDRPARTLVDLQQARGQMQARLRDVIHCAGAKKRILIPVMGHTLRQRTSARVVSAMAATSAIIPSSTPSPRRAWPKSSRTASKWTSVKPISRTSRSCACRIARPG